MCPFRCFSRHDRMVSCCHLGYSSTFCCGFQFLSRTIQSYWLDTCLALQSLEKCAQSMWRLLVKIVPSLTGGSYDGNITALAGELVAMDADVSSEHIFFVFYENFLESFTALKSCDEFHDLPNKASTLAGAGGRQSSREFTVPPGEGQSSTKRIKRFLCSWLVWALRSPLLSFTFWSFPSHGICQLSPTAERTHGGPGWSMDRPSRPRVVS